MRIKDMLLVARAGEPCEALLAVGAHVARQHGARITGVCVYSEPAVGPSNGETDANRRRKDAIESSVAPTEAAYRAAIADHGLSESWAVGEAEERTWALIRQARFADLVLVGLPGEEPLARRLAESLVFNSGAPCVLAPCSAKVTKIERVLLAWDGSREAKRAMDDGLAFMAAAEKVLVVISHEDGDDASYEAHGAHLLGHLSRHGIEAELKVVSKPGEKIGDVLHNECKSFAPDLLIMGAYGHSQAREMVLGGATRAMLARAAQPVLMVH